MDTLEDQAIQSALDGDWNKALSINNKLYKENPKNTDVLNRLAYSHAQLGDFKKACFYYTKTLKIDPYNLIALKNLDKFEKAGHQCGDQAQPNHAHHTDTHISPDMFLADAEKTRIVMLVNLAPTSSINELTLGEEVFPVKKCFELQLKTKNGMYIGTLPDDIGRSIIEAKKKITLCEYFIKDIEDKRVSIYIKWHQ